MSNEIGKDGFKGGTRRLRLRTIFYAPVSQYPSVAPSNRKSDMFFSKLHELVRCLAFQTVKNRPRTDDKNIAVKEDAEIGSYLTHFKNLLSENIARHFSRFTLLEHFSETHINILSLRWFSAVSRK